VVNGHKSAVRADSPDGGTGKLCLGRGMYCPVLLVSAVLVGKIKTETYKSEFLETTT